MQPYHHFQDMDELEAFLRLCKNCPKGRVMSLFKTGSSWPSGKKNYYAADPKAAAASSILLSVMSRRG